MAKKDKLRTFSYITNAYVVLMAVFLLAACNYQNITSLKTPLFYIICGGYTVITLLICIESMAVGIIKPKLIFKKLVPESPTQILLLLYLAFSLISTIFSRYTQAWLGASRSDGFITIAIYVICFYFISKFIKPEKWMLYLFGGAVSVLCVVSIIQLMGSSFLYPNGLNYYDAYIKYSGAYIGTVGNVDFTAAFFTMSVPAFCLYMLKAKEKWRFLFVIPTLLSIAVLLKIWVLLGLVGIFAAACVCFPFALGFKKRGHIIYWSSIFAVALVGIGVIYAVPFKSGLLAEVHNILHLNVSDTFGTGRIHIWSEVLRRVPDNILFGTGPDTMIYANIEPFHRVDETYGEIVALIDNAHNEYLNILFSQGIFAALCFISAIAVAIINFFKKASKSKGVLIFGGAVIGYAVSAFFGVPSLSHTPFFWLCLGLFEYYFNKKEENK